MAPPRPVKAESIMRASETACHGAAPAARGWAAAEAQERSGMVREQERGRHAAVAASSRSSGGKQQRRRQAAAVAAGGGASLTTPLSILLSNPRLLREDSFAAVHRGG